MQSIDLFLGPLYLVLLIVLGRNYWKKHYKKKPIIGKYFMPALALKLFGSISFAIIYQFYYGDGKSLGGDTGFYFEGSTEMYKAWTHEPQVIPEMFMIRAGEYTGATTKYTSNMPTFWRANQEQFTVYRIIGTIEVLGLGAYLPLAFIIGFFAFTGQWKIFETLAGKYPALSRWLAFGILFMPSLVFWGSGVMKDPLCIGALGWIYASLNDIFIRGKAVSKAIIRMPFMLWLLFTLKAYILLSFIPGALIWFTLSFLNRIKNKNLRLGVSIGLIAILLPVGYTILVQTSNISEKYKVNNLEEAAKSFQEFHTYLSEKGEVGSGYQLHISSFSPIGMLMAFPEAVNVALFRPYLWEVHSPIIVLSALESLICFLFTLNLIRRGGIRSFFRGFRNPDVALCMTFAILLSFATGLTAFNFGALSRFRIPVLPFYVAGLVIMNRDIVAKQELKRQLKKLAKK